jgi:hypothetical protein
LTFNQDERSPYEKLIHEQIIQAKTQDNSNLSTLMPSSMKSQPTLKKQIKHPTKVIINKKNLISVMPKEFEMNKYFSMNS